MSIEQHKFDDSTIKAVQSSKRTVLFTIEDTTFILQKDDSIALAKHFNLTSADIE